MLKMYYTWLAEPAPRNNIWLYSSNQIWHMRYGCVEMPTLMPGTYYAAVRGTTTPDNPGKYTMNTYNIRVFSVGTMPYSCTKKTDGGT